MKVMFDRVEQELPVPATDVDVGALRSRRVVLLAQVLLALPQHGRGQRKAQSSLIQLYLSIQLLCTLHAIGKERAGGNLVVLAFTLDQFFDRCLSLQM